MSARRFTGHMSRWSDPLHLLCSASARCLSPSTDIAIMHTKNPETALDVRVDPTHQLSVGSHGVARRSKGKWGTAMRSESAARGRENCGVREALRPESVDPQCLPRQAADCSSSPPHHRASTAKGRCGIADRLVQGALPAGTECVAPLTGLTAISFVDRGIDD